MKKVLITGVDYAGKRGMVGTALSYYLESWGVQVCPFVGDIRDPDNWDHQSEDYDGVIHLAALAGVRQSLEDPDEYWDVNVNGSQQVFKYCDRTETRCMYASSSNAHEWWVNPYAASKKAVEALAQSYSHVESIGMRFHTVWPGREDMLYKRLQKGESIMVNADHTRDWIHVDDLCEAIWLTMINFSKLYYDVLDEKIVDIGSGVSYNVRDVVNKYSKAPTLGEQVDSTPHERKSTKANIQWLINLGFKPKHSIL